jgi:hypothetical protein
MKVARSLLCLLPFLLVLLVPISSRAQDKAGSEVNATGCLQKGSESGGFYLTDASGKMYELQKSKVNLAEHVGHQVTITGKTVENPESVEAKLADSEKKEASSSNYQDVKVASLKMVSESCK